MKQTGGSLLPRRPQRPGQLAQQGRPERAQQAVQSEKRVGRRHFDRRLQRPRARHGQQLGAEFQRGPAEAVRSVRAGHRHVREYGQLREYNDYVVDCNIIIYPYFKKVS